MTVTRSVQWLLAALVPLALGCVEASKLPPFSGFGGAKDAGGTELRLTIASPTDGAVIETPGFDADIVVKVEVEGIELSEFGNVLTMTLDGKEKGRIFEGDGFTFTAVPLGAHTIAVEVVDDAGEAVGGTAGRASIKVTVIQGDTGGDLDAGASECSKDDDCAYLVEGISCQTASCEDGACQTGAMKDGLACDDGDPCTIEDECDGGGCQGVQDDCEDDNPCTTDTCDKKKGCRNNPNTKACDDGDPCTLGDVCSQGACKGQGLLGCDDGDACTTDACDPGSGGCVSLPAVLDCDDDNECTDDACNPDDGTCAHVPAAGNCFDGNLCTDDACDPETGSCAFTPVALDCDDGSLCTNDGCDPLTGECTSALKPLFCNDGDGCTDVSCDPLTGGCLYTPVAIDCNDGDPCTTDACDPKTGGCLNTPIAVNCDDGNVCTKDTCDTGSPGGCKHEPNAGACDDADACTYNDVCAAGACKGTLINCGDGDPCTVDSCAGGSCLNEPTAGACDDGNACTENDSCAGGACVGTTKACDDGDVCTTDTCAPATGCKHTPNTLPCDDGDSCTTGDACKDGACLPKGVNTCDDKNPCTSDLCNALTGTCINQPVEGPCSDGDGCTEGDSCDSGACVPGSLKDCEDANPCTTDFCTGGGCGHSFNSAPCDDGDPCTANDKCAGGTCTPGAPLVCDDGDPCNGVEVCNIASGGCELDGPAPYCGDGTTDWACGEVCDDDNQDGGDGCSADCTSDESCGNDFLDPGEECDDGNKDPLDGCDADCKEESAECTVDGDCDDLSVCTGTEKCNAGACAKGTPLVCSDGIPCTQDGCNPQTGCTFTPNNASCTDGIACTLDTCDPVSGCVFSPTDAACNDGILCTADSCVQGFGCKHVADHGVCEDGNPCTANTCSTLSGCVSTAAAGGTPCDDGNPCTEGDGCNGTACKPGGPKACDDGIPCTLDSCGIGGQCLHAPQNAACDDGNPCTVDSCAEVAGCSHAPSSGVPCDDGDECTLDDSCEAGQCAGGTLNPSCSTTFCTVFGVKGATVDCSLRIARASEAEPVPTGLEFTLSYDTAALTLDNFYSRWCFGPNCFDVPATGAGSTSLQSGHSVSIAPTKIADWSGFGGVIIVNAGDPTSPLSTAWLDEQGEVVGNPVFLTVRFVLAADIDEGAPASVDLDVSVATDGIAQSLVADLIKGIIITWLL
ncbi:MAG: hypothetical protein AMXMBFR64_00660 [Myxococcales bacterium]